MYDLNDSSLSKEEKKRYKKKNLGTFVVNYNDELKQETDLWRAQWHELLSLILPRKGDVYNQVHDNNGNRRVRLYTVAGIQANEELASALHTNLTNPTTQFCEFSTGKIEIDSKPNVAKYLQKRTEVFHSVLNNSNYQTEVHESYLDLGAIGTRVMRIEEDDEEIVRFTCRPIFEFNCDENEHGIIDVLSREKIYTSRQLVRKYGQDLLKNSHYTDEEIEYKTKSILDDVKREYKVIEMFVPSKYLKQRKVIQSYSKPYTMIHVLEDGNCFLKQDWYNELNHAVSRWTKSSDEIFGRGPGANCIAALLMLNELKKLVVQGNQLAIKPPVMVPDDGTYPGFKIFPGAVNYYRTGTRDEIKAFNSGSRLDVADWMIRELQQDIQKAFFIDKIRLPDINRMTREETIVRRDENLRAWAPILGRQEREDLLPTVRRVDAIIERRGLYPDPPEELAGQSLEVKYSSQVARVQKASLADNADQWVGAMVNLANMSRKPEVLDPVDFNQYAKYTASTRSVPADLIKSDDQIEETRQQREAQMQAQMEMARQESDAKAVKDATSAAKNTEGLEA